MDLSDDTCPCTDTPRGHHMVTAAMTSGDWRPGTYTGAQETQEILNDPEAMKAIAAAENEVVLANFKLAIIKLAHEAEVWGSLAEIGVPDEDLFKAVGDLVEDALKARGLIRLKYKVSLL